MTVGRSHGRLVVSEQPQQSGYGQRNNQRNMVRHFSRGLVGRVDRPSRPSDYSGLVVSDHKCKQSHDTIALMQHTLLIQIFRLRWATIAINVIAKISNQCMQQSKTCLNNFLKEFFLQLFSSVELASLSLPNEN